MADEKLSVSLPSLIAALEAHIAQRDRAVADAVSAAVYEKTQIAVVESLKRPLAGLGITIAMEKIDGRCQIFITGAEAVERTTVTMHDAKGRILEFIKKKVPAAIYEESDE